jgi:hypothetical protein
VTVRYLVQPAIAYVLAAGWVLLAVASLFSGDPAGSLTAVLLMVVTVLMLRATVLRLELADDALVVRTVLRTVRIPRDEVRYARRLVIPMWRIRGRQRRPWFDVPATKRTRHLLEAVGPAGG